MSIGKPSRDELIETTLKLMTGVLDSHPVAFVPSARRIVAEKAADDMMAYVPAKTDHFRRSYEAAQYLYQRVMDHAHEYLKGHFFFPWRAEMPGITIAEQPFGELIDWCKENDVEFAVVDPRCSYVRLLPKDDSQRMLIKVRWM